MIKVMKMCPMDCSWTHAAASVNHTWLAVVSEVSAVSLEPLRNLTFLHLSHRLTSTNLAASG